MIDSGARRLLAVKLADFGDALLTTPALRCLRAGHPDAALDILSTPQAAPVYRHCGLVDNVLTLEKERFDRALSGIGRVGSTWSLARQLRAENYDAVVLFHHLTRQYGAIKHAALTLASGARMRAGLVREGSRRGWFLTQRAADPGFGALHEVDVMISVALAAGGKPVSKRLAFLPGAEAERAADQLLSSAGSGSRPRVAMHPGSGGFSSARRWDPRRFAGVADALGERGIDVVVVGRAEDDTARVLAACKHDVMDLTDRTDLPTLGAALSRMDAFVGGDSGVMHLAAAMGTPVVAVFGPSNDKAWGPWWPAEGTDPPGAVGPHTIVTLPMPCRPCLYRDYALGSRDGCATRDCLAWLEPGTVVEAVANAVRMGKQPWIERRAAGL